VEVSFGGGGGGGGGGEFCPASLSLESGPMPRSSSSVGVKGEPVELRLLGDLLEGDADVSGPESDGLLRAPTLGLASGSPTPESREEFAAPPVRFGGA
jgi:hypothetical protein